MCDDESTKDGSQIIIDYESNSKIIIVIVIVIVIIIISSRTSTRSSSYSISTKIINLITRQQSFIKNDREAHQKI